jgi:hypothetical protein
MMNNNIVGQAIIVDYRCAKCQDSFIQTGIAELDGHKVVVIRLCECQNKIDKPIDDGVQYDF